MKTLTTIQHHISTLTPGEIFTTKEMLQFGDRKRVDLVLSRMVREGRIRRLSFGVFCLSKIIPPAIPTLQNVVESKMKNSQNNFVEISQCKLGENPEEIVFFTDGYSSSFMYQGKRIVLKKISGRKYRLSQTKTGQVLLAIWLTGRRNVDAQMVHDLIQVLPSHERTKLRQYLPLVPGWLHNFILAEIIK